MNRLWKSTLAAALVTAGALVGCHHNGTSWCPLGGGCLSGGGSTGCCSAGGYVAPQGESVYPTPDAPSEYVPPTNGGGTTLKQPAAGSGLR